MKYFQSPFKKAFQSAVFWGFLATALRLGNVVLVLPFILRNISSEDLGWWYVFTSLGSLAVLLDMGFWPTVSRSIAYLWAGATNLLPFGVADPSKSPSGATPNWPVLADLLISCKFLYIVIGLLVLVFMSSVGMFWLSIIDSVKIPYLPFSVYSLSVAIGCVVAVWPAILTGINRVRESNQIIALAMLVNYAVIAILVQQGAGLWAMVFGVWAKTFVERVGTYLILRRHASALLNLHGQFRVRLIKILWPNAWRTGLVGLGAFLIIQANTLICSQTLGLLATASYGISQQITWMLIGVASIWINVKQPIMAQLRAKGNIVELRFLFARRVMLAIATYIMGAICAVAMGPVILQRIGSKTMLIPPMLFVFQLVVGFLEMHHIQYATLVISENRNPFVWPALISGVFIIILSYPLALTLGIFGIILSTGMVQACSNNWWPVVLGIRSLRIRPLEYLRVLRTAFMWG